MLVSSPAPTLVIIVAASTGDGDPPDNSASFYAHMRRKLLPSHSESACCICSCMSSQENCRPVPGCNGIVGKGRCP